MATNIQLFKLLCNLLDAGWRQNTSVDFNMTVINYFNSFATQHEKSIYSGDQINAWLGCLITQKRTLKQRLENDGGITF